MNTRSTAGLFCLVLFFICCHPLQAATISNSGIEVEYSYETQFRSLVPTDEVDYREAESEAKSHADHLFGIFHSPDYIESYDFPTEMSEGFAGTQYPKIIEAKFVEVSGDDYAWVAYKMKSQMLVLKPVAEKWFGQQTETTIELPLLRDLPAIYQDDVEQGYRKRKWKKCTDSHYWTSTDFFYFYNPYRCPQLSRPPLADSVSINIKKIKHAKPSTKVPLKKIHSNNGNGNLVVLYYNFGFDHTPESGSSLRKIKKDVGYQLYAALGDRLVDAKEFRRVANKSELDELLGSERSKFKLTNEVALADHEKLQYISTFVKKSEGKTWVVRSGLFDTNNTFREQALVSFPKFWQEAWVNGDFIYFGGHSGDGASLSIENMLANLGIDSLRDVEFRKGKTQIAFFDACSSYAHFRDMYRNKKSDGLHIISYGVVSLYHTADTTISFLTDLLLSTTPAPTWLNTMENIEKAQLRPHLDHLYYEPDATEIYNEYIEKKILPSYMLNVWVP